MQNTETQNAEPPAIQGSNADWIADRAIRGLIKLCHMLPYRRRVPVMGRVVARVIAPLVGYRRRAMRNLEFIYPELDASQRRNLADRVCDNAGRTLIENYSPEDFSKHLQGTRVFGDGLPAIEQAKRDGRPVMFVTAHFGNHDAARYVLKQHGYDIGGLYRPMSNPFFNEHYVETLAHVSGKIFPQSREGIVGLRKYLSDGGMAVLFIDVSVSNGTPITFLGQPALTALSSAVFSMKSDALMIPYFAIRKSNGLDFEVLVDAPIPHSEPLQMMEEATARLEAQVNARPEQWFWVHRRWKGAVGY